MSEDVDWDCVILVFLWKHDPQKLKIGQKCIFLATFNQSSGVPFQWIAKISENNYIFWDIWDWRFLCEKNESYMISKKKIICFFFIFLLHFENFQLFFKWNITPLLIIFLMKSHSLIFIHIVSRNFKKFLKCNSFEINFK